MTCSSRTRSGWIFCFTYTVWATSFVGAAPTVLRPLPAQTPFGFVAASMPSRSRPNSWHSQMALAPSGLVIGSASSEGLEGARDHDFDGDAIERLWEIREDFRTLLLHIDADDFLAVLLADADADDPAHLHEARLVAALHLGCRCHGSFMPFPGDKTTAGAPGLRRPQECPDSSRGRRRSRRPQIGRAHV